MDTYAWELCASTGDRWDEWVSRWVRCSLSPRGVLVAPVVAVVTPGLASSSPSQLRAILHIALLSSFSSPALLTYLPQEMSPRSQWFQSCKIECVLSKDVQAFDMSLGIAVKKVVMTSIRNYPLKPDRTSFRKSGKNISINRQWKKPFNVFGTKGWKQKTT